MFGIFVYFLGLVCIPVLHAAIPNVFCMVEHCSSQMEDCFEDSDCKKAMLCFTGCGTNQTYFKCMAIPAPKPPVTCHRPTKIATSFDIESIKGTWYVVRGKNPIYDCFNCQITTVVRAQQGLFSAVEHFNVNAIDGTIKHKTVVDTVTQWNATVPGILKYSSLQMGQKTTSEWRILDFAQDYIFAYYCGSISADYFYEGSVVYSKSTTLSSSIIARLQRVATDAGLDFNTYCQPSYNNCNI